MFIAPSKDEELNDTSEVRDDLDSLKKIALDMQEVYKDTKANLTPATQAAYKYTKDKYNSAKQAVQATSDYAKTRYNAAQAKINTLTSLAQETYKNTCNKLSLPPLSPEDELDNLDNIYNSARTVKKAIKKLKSAKDNAGHTVSNIVNNPTLLTATGYGLKGLHYVATSLVNEDDARAINNAVALQGTPINPHIAQKVYSLPQAIRRHMGALCYSFIPSVYDLETASLGYFEKAHKIKNALPSIIGIAHKLNNTFSTITTDDEAYTVLQAVSSAPHVNEIDFDQLYNLKEVQKQTNALCNTAVKSATTFLNTIDNASHNQLLAYIFEGIATPNTKDYLSRKKGKGTRIRTTPCIEFESFSKNAIKSLQSDIFARLKEKLKEIVKSKDLLSTRNQEKYSLAQLICCSSQMDIEEALSCIWQEIKTGDFKDSSNNPSQYKERDLLLLLALKKTLSVLETVEYIIGQDLRLLCYNKDKHKVLLDKHSRLISSLQRIMKKFYGCLDTHKVDTVDSATSDLITEKALKCLNRAQELISSINTEAQLTCFAFTQAIDKVTAHLKECRAYDTWLLSGNKDTLEALTRRELTRKIASRKLIYYIKKKTVTDPKKEETLKSNQIKYLYFHGCSNPINKMEEIRNTLHHTVTPLPQPLLTQATQLIDIMVELKQLITNINQEITNINQQSCPLTTEDINALRTIIKELSANGCTNNEEFDIHEFSKRDYQEALYEELSNLKNRLHTSINNASSPKNLLKKIEVTVLEPFIGPEPTSEEIAQLILVSLKKLGNEYIGFLNRIVKPAPCNMLLDLAPTPPQHFPAYPKHYSMRQRTKPLGQRLEDWGMEKAEIGLNKIIEHGPRIVQNEIDRVDRIDRKYSKVREEVRASQGRHENRLQQCIVAVKTAVQPLPAKRVKRAMGPLPKSPSLTATTHYARKLVTKFAAQGNVAGPFPITNEELQQQRTKRNMPALPADISFIKNPAINSLALEQQVTKLKKAVPIPKAQPSLLYRLRDRFDTYIQADKEEIDTIGHKGYLLDLLIMGGVAWGASRVYYNSSYYQIKLLENFEKQCLRLIHTLEAGKKLPRKAIYLLLTVASLKKLDTEDRNKLTEMIEKIRKEIGSLAQIPDLDQSAYNTHKNNIIEQTQLCMAFVGSCKTELKENEGTIEYLCSSIAKRYNSIKSLFSKKDSLKPKPA